MSDTLNVSEQHKLIARIQKLMALAKDRGATEAEAEAATNKVQELLAQYNLTLSALEQAGGEKEARDRTTLQQNAFYDYQRHLMSAIAKVNFCMVWVIDDVRMQGKKNPKPHKVKSYVILGRKSNVVATLNMFGYLHDTIERLVPVPNTERNSKWALSWKKGCAYRLIDRINEKARKLRAESEAAAAAQRAAGAAAGALTLVNVDEAEHAANYDARFGEGAWARKKQREAEWDAKRDEWAKEDAARRAAVEELERAKLEAMTPGQRKRYEEAKARKEQREKAKSDRWWAREVAKTDWDAYHAGHAKADDIGLDEQIEHEEAVVAGRIA